MANKKTQKRNKKRKQEQMKTSTGEAKQPERKPFPWGKLIGIVLIVALIIGSFVAKFLYDRSLSAATVESNAAASVSPSSAA